MGSPEKPIDVEMEDMDETNRLNPDVDVKGGKEPAEDRFTGLKKDELLEVSSQKKWVVARWILFILFWLVWIGMLVGAIIIVVKAPRCKEEPSPPWFQDTTLYEVNVRKFGGSLDGVSEHVPYVRFLHAKALAVSGACDPNDISGVVNGDVAGFKKLLETANDEKIEKDVKVVVNIAIDKLSTSSDQFLESANVNCTGGNPTRSLCSLFLWQPNSSLPVGENWVYHPAREENYKASEDGNFAYLNFGSQQAVDYVKEVVKTWIGRGADGFKLGDFAMIGSDRSQRASLIASIFETFNDTQRNLEDKDKRVIGLFLSSSDASTQAELFPEDKEQVENVPVVLYSGLYGLRTSDAIKRAIEEWRNTTEPFTSSYALNSMDNDLLSTTFGASLAAGYTLLSYGLPGVPFLRAGDETLLENDVFTWKENTELDVSIPQNSSEKNLHQVSNVADFRVNPYRAMQSLRWDHNEDSSFMFLETNSSQVVAFERKWDKKPYAVTIFNPTNTTIIVAVSNGKYAKGEVLGYTGDGIGQSSNVDLAVGVEMSAGSALVLKVQEKK